MAYTKTTWVNGSSPAISADNLNKMETGIYNNDVAVTSATTWINAFGFTYEGDVGSTVYSGTWTPAKDGIAIMVGQWNTAHGAGYWYIQDSTEGINVACRNTDYTNGFYFSACFPVIAGHSYTTATSSAVTKQNCHYYSIGG